MEITTVTPPRRTKTTVWLTLLLLAASAWAIIIQQPWTMGRMNGGMAGMGVELLPALLFLPLWIIMMVAMMFPAVAPVVSLFATITHKRQAMGQRATPTWIFLAGYLVVWSLFGVGAFLLSLLVPSLGMMALGLRMDHPMVAGMVLVGAGLYQVSRLKRVCLHHCRSPLSVILHRWRDGRSGTFRMGFGHGTYCLGCCWGLMLILFVVGLMNVAWMMLLSLTIFVEKVVPHGAIMSQLTALALVLFGMFTFVTPLISGLSH